MKLQFVINNYQKGACLRMLGDKVISTCTIANNKHEIICVANSENEKAFIEKVLARKAKIID